jgi:DNA-binding NtrC family response regulator
MVLTRDRHRTPFNLVVTGEAQSWLPALHQIVGAEYLVPRPVSDDRELLDLVGSGEADAAVLDDTAQWRTDVLQLLRMIRRVNRTLPVVVVVTGRRDRHWLEDALRLTAFSVVTRPLELEELLRQIARMMQRLDQMLRQPGAGGQDPEAGMQ